MKYISKHGFCIITGSSSPDLHHVKTRGSGGTDDTWNLMPLSRTKHTEVHQIGLSRFCEKYPAVREWLISNGWHFEPVLLRWHHEITKKG